jgi:tRNA/tmRNA/rRNA uracil-C5-methylase (TrmA/RlmC/RlmD family)
VEVRPAAEIIDYMPAQDPWNYRNRVQLRGFEGDLGFFARRTNDRVNASGCDIARAEINAVWEQTRKEGRALPRPYKVEVEVLPGGQIRKVWNAGHGAAGFRQINDAQNEVLKAWVSAQIPDGVRVWDLYGGSGNLSLGLIPRVASVECVDVGAPLKTPPDAPSGFRFWRKATLPWLQRDASSLSADVAVLDPPREGLGEDFLRIEKALVKGGVSRVIAVGCDADSWARDMARFDRTGWRIERVGLIDFFPQTPHVEAVASLTR